MPDISFRQVGQTHTHPHFYAKPYYLCVCVYVAIALWSMTSFHWVGFTEVKRGQDVSLMLKIMMGHFQLSVMTATTGSQWTNAEKTQTNSVLL